MVRSVHLLPQAKECTLLEGTFLLDSDVSILIPAQAGEEALFAARQLGDEIYQSTCLTLPIIKAFAPFRSEDLVMLACGKEHADALGIEPVQIQAPDSVADQAYILTITPTIITLYADTPVGLFYAVQTLRQLARLHGPELPTLIIRDWPILPHRGLMLDVSRRKVPTLNTLKHLVAELGHYKLNVLQLYTEHTFQFPRHPKIGAGCDSLTSQDILELDAYCRQHHVELMPNLQSFGHACNTLTIPEYQHQDFSIDIT